MKAVSSSGGWLRWSLVALLAAAAGAGYWLLTPITGVAPLRVGDLVIDPGHAVDPRQAYELTLWETPVHIPDRPSNAYREALQGALLEFADRFPNVTVRVETVPGSQLEQKLKAALEAGSPPDVVALPYPLPPQPLQVPVTPYLGLIRGVSPKGGEGKTPPFYPAASDPWTFHGHLWAFPRWIHWEAWAGHQGDLVARGIDLQGIIRYGWSWSDVIDLADRLRESGTREGMALDVTSPVLYLQLMANAGWPWWSGEEGLLWSKEGLAEVARFLRELQEAQALGVRPEAASLTRVDRFGSEQSLLTAPVNPWLFRALQKRLSDEAVLLPVPHHPQQHEVAWLIPSGYAVFRQQAYRGDATLRAAMELASFLSRRLGAWTARSVGLLPASPEDLRQWEEQVGLHSLARGFLLDYLAQFPQGRGQAGQRILLPPAEAIQALGRMSRALWQSPAPSPERWAEDTARALGLTGGTAAR